MNILNTLKDFGMHEHKARVYLACLELGTGTATEIATKAQVHRTTVYEILNDLLADGLISTTPKDATARFTAEQPEQLKRILKEKERRVSDILPELRSRFNLKQSKPKVKFYEGVDGVRAMFMDTLTTTTKVLRALLSVSDFYEFLGTEWFDEYTRKRIAGGIQLTVIRPQSKEVTGVFPPSIREKREVRIAPCDMEFSLSQYLYDDKVVLISTAKEGYGMIIESKEYYTTQLHLFETLWSVSRIMKSVD